MELPRRDRGDELLKPGRLTELRGRLRRLAERHDLATVIACAFDHRTRMLPFFYADKRMAPAGVRAIGAAMLDAGFSKTRIVLQQWNRQFRPSRMQLDGRIPDLFMVSSMQIHSAECRALIQDACRIEPARRPLIIAGGPKTIYEPWDAFNDDPSRRWGADVAVTGEEYVLLELLEVLLSIRATGEPMRSTFIRARDSGLLDGVPGLVYARGAEEGLAEELIDTGIQRLVGDLDELPHPALGFRLLEPPSRRTTLSAKALEPGRVTRYTPIGSLVMTFGCKFNCPYCPIPAYNQRQHRLKSPERIRDEFLRLNDEYGMNFFFGTDDNFFNDHQRALGIIELLAKTRQRHLPYHKRVRWGTEVTVHDTLAMRDHMRTARSAGIRALWMGIEDLTATLVKKGQSADKTRAAFAVLKQSGICPMPMMMHHDSQPLYTRGSPYGLLNQVNTLRKAGAVSLQVLMMTPATGSRLYREAFTSGLVYESVGGQRVEPHMLDANYVIASEHPQPWRKQLNIMAAYVYFYNPLRCLWALFRPRTRLYFADAIMQAIGMWGTAHTIRRTIGWAVNLMRGAIIRRREVPGSKIPMRAPDGGPASHSLIDARPPATTPQQPVNIQVRAPDSRADGGAHRTLVPAPLPD